MITTSTSTTIPPTVAAPASPASGAGTTVSTSTSTTTTVPDPNDLSARYLQQDLNTETIEELADRLRELGLSDQGSRDDLRQRLVAHFGITTTTTTTTTIQGAPKPKNPMIVTIQTGASAEYLSVDAGKDKPKEDVMRLTGGVVLIIEDPKKGTKNRIQADEVTYNKQKEVMTARGNVLYTLTENGKDQYFSGEEMTFSLHDSEGRFLDGIMQKDQVIKASALSGSTTPTAISSVGTTLTFIISGVQISRNADNLVVLDKPNMTSSKFDPPNYHIEANKIWSLSPGEWAISDATLFVGRIPLFYFPFFYNPPDDVFFHPSIGFLTVQGFFLQTTTYILGRKPDTSSADTLSFMQFDSGLDSTNSDLRPHGLFLQKIPKDADAPPPNPAPVAGQYLKVLADYYTQLGYLIGLDGDLHNSIFSTLNFKTDIAFSRAVYLSQAYTGGVYTNYDLVGPSGDQTAQDYWDSGYLGGNRLPFRFNFNLNLGFQQSGFTFTLGVPFQSDPFFQQNFLNTRKEDIDWTKLLGLNKDTLAATAITTSGLTPESLNPMTLGISGPLNTPMFGQWLQSISLDRLNANFNWSAPTQWLNAPYQINPTKNSDVYWAANSYFYKPLNVVLPDLSVTFTGILAKYPGYIATVQAPAQGQTPQAPLKTVNGLIAPWEDKPTIATGGDAGTNSVTSQSTAGGISTASLFDLLLPYKNPLANNDASQNEFAFNLGYTVNPTLNIGSTFAGSRATDLNNISLDTDYWLMSEGLDTKISPVLTLPYSFGAVSIPFEFKTQAETFLQRPQASDIDDSGADPQKLTTGTYQTDIEAQQEAKNISLTLNNATVQLSPLKGTGIFDASTIGYTIGFYIYRLQVLMPTDLVHLNGIQDEEWFSWRKTEMFISHSVNATIAMDLTPFKWSVGATYNLPPLQRTLTFNSTMSWWLASLTANETITYSTGDAAPQIGDLTGNLTVPIGDWFASTTGYDVNLSSKNLNTIAPSITLFGAAGVTPITVGLTWNYLSGEQFDKNQLLSDGSNNPNIGTWDNLANTSKLQLHTGNLKYDLNLVTDPFWKNRITTSLQTGFNYTQDFIVYTNSNLTYYLTWGFIVQEFINIAFTVKGANTQMYRYFPGLNDPVQGSGTSLNFFDDLGKSFNFFQASQADRYATNFDLSEFDITATHQLGDWQIALTYTGKPLTNVAQTGTSWDNTFSVSIAWIPIPEISTNVAGENSTLNVK